MTFAHGSRFACFFLHSSFFSPSFSFHHQPFLFLQLLEEIKCSRQTFDTSETEKQFGPITILYAQVQSSVTHKYDFWHKDVLKKFGSKLGDEMKAFHVRIFPGRVLLISPLPQGTISAARLELEHQTIDTSSSAEAIAFIIKVQDIKNNLGVSLPTE